MNYNMQSSQISQTIFLTKCKTSHIKNQSDFTEQISQNKLQTYV